MGLPLGKLPVKLIVVGDPLAYGANILLSLDDPLSLGAGVLSGTTHKLTSQFSFLESP
jgi:hypothetical protein